MAARYGRLSSSPYVLEDANTMRVLASRSIPDVSSFPGKALTLLTQRGQSASAAHLTNVWIHIVNTALVAAVGVAAVSPGAGVAAGLIFAVHPLNVEAVAYVSARSDLLMTTCALLAAIAVLSRPTPWTGLLLLLSVAVAPFCDELGGVVAGLVVVTSALLRPRAPWHRLIVLAMTAFAASAAIVAYPYLRVMWQGWLHDVPFSAGGYLYWQLVALAHLLALVIDPRWLSIDHGVTSLSVWWQAWAVSLVLVAAFAAGYYRASRPIVTWTIAWVAIAVLPRFLFRTTEWLHEHQLYLAMAGLSVGLGAAWAALTQVEWWRRSGTQPHTVGSFT